MTDFIIPGILGVLIICMGITNMKGNLSTLHWYHRQRVKEEDRKAFGRMVGLGTILIGVAIVIYAVLSYLALLLQNGIFTTVGMAIMVIAIILGLGLSFYAMIKYNKGIF
jgi:hypothetical protein